MSTNDLTLTLVGWVATDPKLYTGESTTPFTSFRMASTRRYFDRTQNAWIDGRTEWFTIKSWRAQARNVALSLRKSDPVMVLGRLATEEWTAADGQRTSLVLEALAIGPDLTYGQVQFARTVHVAASREPGESESGTAGEAGGVGAGETAAVGDQSDDGDGPGFPAAGDGWLSDPELAAIEDEVEVAHEGAGLAR